MILGGDVRQKKMKVNMIENRNELLYSVKAFGFLQEWVCRLVLKKMDQATNEAK